MVDRDDLLRRTDLAALLDELSPSPPTRLGQNARWRCIDPGHDDQHPSISMFTDRRGVQRWRCWSGGHGGTAIDAILIAHGGTVAEAMAELERRAGIPRDDERDRSFNSAPSPRQSQEVPISPGLLEYVSACERLLWRPIGRPILDYMVHERGLAPGVLEKNRVGADPGPAVLRRAVGLPRGGPAAVLPTLGLSGQVAYVQARYLDPAEGHPKYDNPASRLAVNPRIGWASPAREQPSSILLVCEGVIDALAVAGAGWPAVAVLGATYVDGRLVSELVHGAAGRHILIAFDGDQAGRRAAVSLSAGLESMEVQSKQVCLPPGRDVSDVLHESGTWLSQRLPPASVEREIGRWLQPVHYWV